MKSVKIAELKDHLSEHLRAVERGAEVVVTDRSRPIARIVPIDEETQTVNLVSPSRDFSEIRDRDRSPADWRISSLTLLLEERRER
jgi:prevent-host-death family protein